MPAKYEAIRDSLTKKGMGLAEAKTHAAKIYNSQRKPGVAPVTGKAEKRVGVKTKG